MGRSRVSVGVGASRSSIRNTEPGTSNQAARRSAANGAASNSVA
jgi:hypothetical protein